MSRCFVSRGRRGTSWHSEICNASKVVLCGRRNTFATFSDDVLQFSWQAQHFGRVHRHFAWQAQHFRRVALRVFCESHCQGCVKWRQGANSVARVAFCDMCWTLKEASHETSILTLQNLEVPTKTRRKRSILKLQSVKIGESLARNARFGAPTCLVSGHWFSGGFAVSMGEAAKHVLSACFKLWKLEEVSHTMLILVFLRVSFRVSGFPVASPCLWGKLQNVSFSKISKQVVLSFCVAGVALCDIPTCLITCRKCQTWRKSRTKCSFCCTHVSRLESLVFLWRRRVYGGSSALHSLHFTLHTLHFALPLLTPHSTLYTPHSTLYTPHSTLYTLHSSLHTLHSKLLTLHSTLHTPHFPLHTPHFTLHTLHSSLHTLHFHFTLYTPHSTLYTLHFTLYTPHSTLYTLHFTLHTPHSTLYTPHFTPLTPHFTLHTWHSTLHTLHFTLYTIHSTLHTLHFTLHAFHFTLHTPHFTLYTFHFPLLTLHFTLHTLQFTLHTPHPTLYTPHSTLYTLHSTLHTLHSTLYTLHSILHTLHSAFYTLHTPHSTLYTPDSLLHTPHSALYTFHSTLQTGNKGSMYKTVQRNYCRKVLCVTAYPCVLTSVPLTYVWAFGFVGCILFFYLYYMPYLSYLCLDSFIYFI